MSILVPCSVYGGPKDPGLTKITLQTTTDDEKAQHIQLAYSKTTAHHMHTVITAPLLPLLVITPFLVCRAGEVEAAGQVA